MVFWGGMILLGSIIPAVVLLIPRTGKSIPWIIFSSVLVVFGVMCERYLIVIPGQDSRPGSFPEYGDYQFRPPGCDILDRFL